MVVGGGSGLPWSPHVLSRIEEHWDFSGPAFRRTSPSRSACACGDTCRLGGKTGVRLEVEGLKWCNDKHVLYIYIYIDVLVSFVRCQFVLGDVS